MPRPGTQEYDDLVALGPTPPDIDPDTPTGKLVAGVRSALIALPAQFVYRNTISGIPALDLFNLNTLLGAGIEAEVVKTLNALKHIWDPDDEWVGYSFRRSSQAFPDVRLERAQADGTVHTAIGIELKGWFMLAKEGEPSLRYRVTPDACAEHDLICVVPWYLSDAVSGTPLVSEPWVESARFAAEFRDFWWQNLRDAQTTKLGIDHPPATPYPGKADLILAVPEYDGGSNFGRLPRCTPLMDQFIATTLAAPILGIPANDWYRFLKLHTDGSDPEVTTLAMQTSLDRRMNAMAPDAAQQIIAKLLEISKLIEG